MKKLTELQKQIISFTRVYTARMGNTPTVHEIGDAFGIKSTNVVVGHLKAIEAKGRLRRLRFMLRGIEVLDNLRIRFCGVVS